MGVHEGRPFMLWLPDSPPPWPAMVIVHGAGSRKENHGDFGRACSASGWAALGFDQRGHGASEDGMSPAALGDVAKMARFLAGVEGVDAARVCVRGSSMGGFMAIQAAATAEQIAGAIAICPAGADHLRRGLRAGTLQMRIDPGGATALDAWLTEHDLGQAVELMGAKPLLLIHASGDEQIPSEASEQLYAHAREPRKLILLPGGHHRSAQHDAELQGVALRWMERSLRSRQLVGRLPAGIRQQAVHCRQIVRAMASKAGKSSARWPRGPRATYRPSPPPARPREGWAGSAARAGWEARARWAVTVCWAADGMLAPTGVGHRGRRPGGLGTGTEGGSGTGRGVDGRGRGGREWWAPEGGRHQAGATWRCRRAA